MNHLQGRFLIVCVILLCAATLGHGVSAENVADGFPDMYNVVWDSQSQDASGSMPVGGGRRTQVGGK